MFYIIWLLGLNEALDGRHWARNKKPKLQINKENKEQTFWGTSNKKFPSRNKECKKWSQINQEQKTKRPKERRNAKPHPEPL